MKRCIGALLAVLLVGVGQVQGTIIVHTTDFMADANRTNFNGFEGLTPVLIDGSIGYTEDGISVIQVDGDAEEFDISTTWFTPEGDRGWYANGGDYGYTRLTLSSGAEMDSIGMLVRAGYTDHYHYVMYELRSNGNPILSGGVGIPNTDDMGYYLGFSGGGFDEVLLRADEHYRLPIDNGLYQSLAIDAIEVGDLDIHGPVPGDCDRDGKVNDMDAAILATFWQYEGPLELGREHGDFNGDGEVTDADAAILATHWQEGVEGSAPIPEPSMPIALLSMAVVGVLIYVRRRHRCG